MAGDQASLRRDEELELAQIARQRRARTETLATDRQVLELDKERLHAQLAADRDKVTAEAPVRLLRLKTERGILAEEKAVRELQNQVRALEVERDLLLSWAQQDLRMAILPLEQAPQIVEAASNVLRGTNLSIYGEGAELLGQLTPLFDYMTRALQKATQGPVEPDRPSGEPAPAGVS